MEEKLKVLYISSIPLVNKTGGSAVMYNHLADHHFEVYDLDDTSLQKPFSTIKLFRKLEWKLQNSRFYYWILACRHLTVKRLISKKELEKIKSFEPKLVITVAHGDLFWLAMKIAKKLQLPLISVFHDWWPELCDQEKKYPLFYRKSVNYRFRSLHKKSDCSLCITEAMKDELGPNSRSEVVYPCTDISNYAVTTDKKTAGQTFKLLYAGNVMKNYGRLLQQMMLSKPADESIELTILGDTWDWPADLVEFGRRSGMLKPPVDVKQFRVELSNASAFLVVLDFDQDVFTWTKTLFPSKISNYAKYGKPILLWGPSYSSGAAFLNQYNAGIIVTSPDVKTLWNEIIALKNSEERQQYYSQKANYIHREILNPITIQEKFLHIVEETTKKRFDVNTVL